MTAATQMALRQVKDRLSQAVERIEREHDRVVITKHGRPAAAVVSIDDLESLEEALDVMAGSELVGQIRDSLASSGREPARKLAKDEALALIHSA